MTEQHLQRRFWTLWDTSSRCAQCTSVRKVLDVPRFCAEHSKEHRALLALHEELELHEAMRRG